MRSLRVAYGRTLALAGVTLDIEPGIVGVFGPNGSGKSTLLRVLAGLLPPTSGEVLWRGEAVRSSSETFRRTVAYAGHASGLYSRLTVDENLRLFAALHGAPEARVADMLRALGLEERASTLVGELSAGFRRRAAVARALLHEPDLLLLDEPYANLDDEASELVSAAVRRWHSPERVALVATHGAKRLKRYAHAGLILKEGEVAVYGRYDRARTPEPVT
jgi:heme exporter protein A